MLSLLYRRSVGRTARALAKALDITPLKEAASSTVVVRWGSSRPADFDRAINPIGAIRLTADGKLSLEHLAANDVLVPTVFNSPPENPDVYPILGRRRNHRAGLDIKICETLEEAQTVYNTGESSFFTQLENVTTEFGIHVFSGEVIKMFRKVPRTENCHPLIHTSAFGWGYHRVRLTSNYPKAQAVAISAVEVLGLAFGRVDVACCPRGRYIVFEANTAPGLNSATLPLYATRLTEYIEGLGVTNEI